MTMTPGLWAVLGGSVAVAAPIQTAPAPLPALGQPVTGLSADQMFDIARRAEGASATAEAIAIYEALARDPEPQVRQEARFRHGQLLARQGRRAEAATLYRAILDEEPGAARVRLELAALLAAMGDLRSARRALLQVQASSLPPDVALIVDKYAAALRSNKPFTASLELALAPSTNINRATSATTLDTILAPFDLSDDARARSGLGVKPSGQILLRAPLRASLGLTARLSGQGTFYRKSSFNDMIGAAQLGLEVAAGKALLRPSVGRSYRWYGTQLYATTDTLTLSAGRAVGRRAQVEVEGGYGRADYRLNDLQDGQIYTASVAYERAVSQRAGGSLRVSGERQVAADPGYSTTSATAQLLAWREAGRASLFATASLSRLGADARLALFPERRREWRVAATAGATLRQLTVHGFAPLVRATYERNRSSVGLYDYRLLSADVGITRAF
ncbi:surface lipoprotein assembly modifier [uncultured Sphingomonas sp.]|uniref:surface lipoprotein assembly modifier n=1 Tax=uncultured Sphingomonas sp. TaxID=158754 RepID=UPI00374A23FE